MKLMPMALSNDRLGWFSAGPLSGRDALKSDIRFEAGSGWEPSVWLRAGGPERQTFVEACNHLILVCSCAVSSGFRRA
jgi:hypothetical protein